MKHAIHVTLFSALALLAIAGSAFAIVGGEYDADNDYANVGAFVLTKQPSTSPTFILPQTHSSCSLVHPRVVLTAAHTVAGIQSFIDNHADIGLEDFGVCLRPDVHESGAKVYRIQEMRMHPDHADASRGDNSIDVGVVILSEPVTGVTPVELPALGYLDDLELDRGTSESKPKFTIVGYGTTNVPKTVQMLPPGERRYALATFKSLRPNYLMLSQNFELGEGGVSRGDSGGACFWTRGDGSRVMVGVTVLSDAASVTYGGCVRTDLATVRAFILDAIDDAGN